MRDSDIGLSADELIDLAKSLSKKYTQEAQFGSNGYETTSPLIRNEYFVELTASVGIAADKKSKKILNGLPAEGRPSTDSLYFGKV